MANTARHDYKLLFNTVRKHAWFNFSIKDKGSSRWQHVIGPNTDKKVKIVLGDMVIYDNQVKP